MPQTLSAAAVAVIVLIPGAMYVWAVERQTGRWGITAADRTFRFVGVSAIFHALIAPITYQFVIPQLRAARASEPLSWWCRPFVLAYVVVPVIIGSSFGSVVRSGYPWAMKVFGANRPPRPWDYLFSRGLDGWVRVRLRSGTWIGGAYAFANGRRSYASGYPDAQELYLAATVQVDPETGDWLYDDDGQLVLSDGGLLLKWDDVEYLEFVDSRERIIVMADKQTVDRRPIEKRGGYESSGVHAKNLQPPKPNPAPGSARPAPKGKP